MTNDQKLGIIYDSITLEEKELIPDLLFFIQALLWDEDAVRENLDNDLRYVINVIDTYAYEHNYDHYYLKNKNRIETYSRLIRTLQSTLNRYRFVEELSQSNAS